MPVQIDSCKYSDFSPLAVDSPEPPICKLGHGWSSDCLKENLCPDYKPSTAFTLDEVRTRLMGRQRSCGKGECDGDIHQDA